MLRLAVGFALVAGAAQAGQVLAADPDGIVELLAGEGLAPRLSVDATGDPLIQYRDGGHPYTLMFFGCTEGAGCTSLSFHAAWKTAGAVDAATANRVNGQSRYVVLEIDALGDAVLHMDVYTGRYGLAAEDFAALVHGFSTSASSLEAEMGFVAD